jgi:hypothetical protein
MKDSGISCVQPEVTVNSRSCQPKPELGAIYSKGRGFRPALVAGKLYETTNWSGANGDLYEPEELNGVGLLGEIRRKQGRIGPMHPTA